jgi:predicted ribosome quality control (RQC) complex YloA/Tae2 family protein
LSLGQICSLQQRTGERRENTLEEMLASEKTLGRAIGKNVSLPRKYVREVLTRLGFDETTPTHGLEGRSGELASTLRSLVEEAIEKPTPSVCSTPEGEEIYVVRPTGLERKRQSSSVCELCDELLLPMMMGESAREPQAGELRRREAEATIDRLRRQEKENKERAARLREAAEKARAAPSLEEALKIVESAGEKRERGRGPSSREAAASILFERAKGLEKNAQDAATAAARLAGRLERKRPSEKPQTARLARRTVEWYEKFRWFFTSAGKLALGGRDAQSNGLLVKRHLEEGDTVYHADLFGSPFFVLKGGRAQSDQEVMEVSQATVSFSSAWKTGLGSADAYWVYKDQVSSSAPSGEYLPKGSFLIRGKKNFVQHNLVQLVAGLDEKGRVVCGPESAVARAAMCHVVLTPHREKPSETAKKVARELVKLSGSDLRLSVDDVLRALPPGGAKIVREKARPRSQIPIGGNL